MNDISENLLSLTRLFADDSSLFFSASYLEDVQGIINHDLAAIHMWTKTWSADFNPNKTEAMLFSLRPVPNYPSLTFNNTSLGFVDSHKHLGVTLSKNGQWHNHIENILSSAWKILGIMRKLEFTFSRNALKFIYYILDHYWSTLRLYGMDVLSKIKNLWKNYRMRLPEL